MAATEQPEKHGDAMRTLIAEVGQLVEKQRYAACTALLNGAAQPGDTAAAATLQQQRLICSILLHAQRDEWWQVLALPPASKEPKVRAQLRQLARRVHPDKCSLPGAEAAFKALCLAATRAAGQTEGFDKDGDHGRDSVDGAHWWERWEDTGRGAKRKRAQDRVPDEEEAVWRKQLEQQPLQELRQEVARLQSRLLSKPTAEQPLTLQQKQQRLRHARSVLAERLKAEESRPAAGGGF